MDLDSFQHFFMVFHGFQHFFMVFSRKSRFFGVLKGFDTQNTDFPCFVCINPQKPGFPWFSDQNLESMMSTTHDNHASIDSMYWWCIHDVYHVIHDVYIHSMYNMYNTCYHSLMYYNMYNVVNMFYVINEWYHMLYIDIHCMYVYNMYIHVIHIHVYMYVIHTFTFDFYNWFYTCFNAFLFKKAFYMIPCGCRRTFWRDFRSPLAEKGKNYDSHAVVGGNFGGILGRQWYKKASFWYTIHVIHVSIDDTSINTYNVYNMYKTR